MSDTELRGRGLWRLRAALAVVAVGALGVVWAGCGDDDGGESNAPSTGREQVESGAEEVREGTENAQKEVEEGFDKAQKEVEENVQEGSDEVRKKLEKGQKQAEEAIEDAKEKAERYLP